MVASEHVVKTSSMLVVSICKAVPLVASFMYTSKLNGPKPLHIIGCALTPCTLRPRAADLQSPATFIRELAADCRRFESSLVFIFGDHFLESLLVPYLMHSKARARHCGFAFLRFFLRLVALSPSKSTRCCSSAPVLFASNRFSY